jgi:hypothetical protein
MSIEGNGILEPPEPDIVEKGIVSLDQADLLFVTYHSKLDHYLYRIIPDVHSFDMARRRSPLLAAAICTVASLHHPAPVLQSLYGRCLRELIRLSARCMFSCHNTIHDIQALLIGAFWLQDLSWKFCGTAVRMATEMQFHRAILRIGGAKGPGCAQDYLEARVYYLVYVCDHQLSIAYGRPPMTGEHEAVRLTARFMESPFIVESDTRLISQVQIWSITGQLYETFGSDSSQSLNLSAVPQLRRFGGALDAWRSDWKDRFRKSKHVGNYPQKGVDLHYHFAKLYLGSHAFRGVTKATSGSDSCQSPSSGGVLTPSSLTSSNVPNGMVDTAQSAILSATHILCSINTDTDWYSYLKDLPLYFHTMIAFAAVFLLRVSTDCGGGIRVNAEQNMQLIRHGLLVLDSVAEDMQPKHVLVKIVSGLHSVVDRYRRPQEADMNVHRRLPAVQHNDSGFVDHGQQQVQTELSYATPDFQSHETWLSRPNNIVDSLSDPWTPGNISWIHPLGPGLELYDLLHQPEGGQAIGVMSEASSLGGEISLPSDTPMDL